MKIRVNKAAELTSEQIDSMKRLTDECVRYEGLTLGFPDLDQEGAVVYRYFRSAKDRDPVSFMIVFPEEDCFEITAFTHPSCRCKGYFTALFSAFMEKQEEEVPICFYPDGCSYDALATLDAFECEYSCTEHIMNCNLKKRPQGNFSFDLSLCVCEDLSLLAPIHSAAFEFTEEESRSYLSDAMADDNICWLIKKGETPIGLCLGAADEASVYLFGFCIAPAYQGKGFGKESLFLLLDCLSEAYKTVRVQVSEENEAAFALYRSSGFESTEELMEYWY